MKKKLKAVPYLLVTSTLLSPLAITSHGWAQKLPPRTPPVEKPTKIIRLDAPTITTPQNNTQIGNEAFIIGGKGTYGADVNVKVEGSWNIQMKDKKVATTRTLHTSKIKVTSRHEWATKSIRLNAPPGSQDIRYKITATQSADNRTSRATTVTLRGKSVTLGSTVSPDIRAQVREPFVNITSPKQSEKIAVSMTEICPYLSPLRDRQKM